MSINRADPRDIYSVIGAFWEKYFPTDKHKLDYIFGILSDVALDSHLQVDQLYDSRSSALVPETFEHTWLYRDPVSWKDSGVFHEHYKKEIIPDGVSTAFSFGVRLKNPIVFYNGLRLTTGMLGATITDTQISFNYILPSTNRLTVYGHRVAREEITSAIPINGLVNTLSIETYISTWDITNMCTLTSSDTIYINMRSFYKGEVIEVTEGTTSETISVAATTTQINTLNNYATPTIKRKLNLNIPVDSIGLVENVLSFEQALPPGIYFRVRDAAGITTIYVETFTKSFVLDREYDENTLQVEVLGGSVYAFSITENRLSLLSPFMAGVQAYIYLEYYEKHTHYGEHFDVVTSTDRYQFGRALDPTLSFKIFLNRSFIASNQYTFLDDFTVQFRALSGGTELWLVPGDTIDVFYEDKATTKHHNHVIESHTFTEVGWVTHLNNPVTAEFFPVESYINGRMTRNVSASEGSEVNFDAANRVDIGQTVDVDGGALDYPYYTDLDTDIKYSYFTDNDLPVSWVQKAEYLMSSTDGTDSVPWIAPDAFPDGVGFTIRYLSEPSGIRLHAHKPINDIWLKDTYSVEYTAYRNFGVVLGLPRMNSEYYSKVVLAIMEALWKGSQDYTITNAANIIFGSPFIINSGEILQSYFSGTLTTNKETYILNTLVPASIPNTLTKHHALNTYVTKVDAGDYLAMFASKYSPDFSLARRLDASVDIKLEGDAEIVTIVSDLVTLEDTGINFVDGISGEVWIGDLVYLHSGGTDYVGFVTGVISDHSISFYNNPSMVLFYKEKVVEDGAYTIYCRRTDKMDSGDHLDQAEDVSLVNSVLSDVMQFIDVYKLDLQGLVDSQISQELCRIFMDKITPAYRSWEFYSEVLPEDLIDGSVSERITLTTLAAPFILGGTAIGGGTVG